MTRPIAHKYREGKVKRTLKRGSKALEIVKRKPQVTTKSELIGSSIPGIVKN